MALSQSTAETQDKDFHYREEERIPSYSIVWK
jgi:hypothetical protein